MSLLTERRRNMLSGAISLVLVFGAATLGIKSAFGAFDGGYSLTATFDAAGQGLIEGSDVKIRGIDIGEVSGVELVDRQARVTMRIGDGEVVPRSAQAVVRPKTLFGEKFVDIVPGDLEGSDDPSDHYGDGDEITDTEGGFELEQVLADAYPLLEAIDAAELDTILSELATGAEGMGERVNRQIINSERLTDINARHDADMQQLLGDLADLSNELAGRAEDLVAGARDLNVALPTLNQRGDELQVVLEQASRLSGDLADLLEANRDFLRESVVDGGKAIEVLDGRRDKLIPLVTGLRQYVQTLAQAIRVELDDGTLMAAVKGLLGTDICGPVDCAIDKSASATTARPGVDAAGDTADDPAPSLDPARVTEGAQGLVDTLLGVIGGGG